MMDGQEQSLPLRERGLKYRFAAYQNIRSRVAPLAGAWIEIPQKKTKLIVGFCRSPCGSVD